ncbi:hypothetical protein HIK17_21055, partial [Cronobacter sakazakii]|nr:hypothetical protein [Cronobacter sakazakii]
AISCIAPRTINTVIKRVMTFIRLNMKDLFAGVIQGVSIGRSFGLFNQQSGAERGFQLFPDSDQPVSWQNIFVTHLTL